MGYILENRKEFERLEKQSQHPSYDFKKELAGLVVPARGKVLDAGCGSGIVSRYLAEAFPRSSVVGCDLSEDRIKQARKALMEVASSERPENLTFVCDNLSETRFSDGEFDAIVCRYVFQHLSKDQCHRVLKEFLRCLKPKGTLSIVDFDGTVLNIFPQTETIKEVLDTFEADTTHDMRIGRKLPSLIASEGFTELKWHIEPVQMSEKVMKDEMEMMILRFENTKKYLSQLLNDAKKADRFYREYLELLGKPGTVYFHNKFICHAQRPNHLSLVK